MLYENAFTIDFNALAIQLLPPNYRKTIHIAFIKVIISPLILILNELKKTRLENIYKIEHDSRVGKIEKVLNDNFDKIVRRIRIQDGGRKTQTYSFFTEENKTQLITPFTTYFPSEVSEFSADFEVCVPLVVGLAPSDLTRLSNLVKYYSDKDKHFIIKQT